jgi:hypothetical protein
MEGGEKGSTDQQLFIGRRQTSAKQKPIGKKAKQNPRKGELPWH